MNDTLAENMAICFIYKFSQVFFVQNTYLLKYKIFIKNKLNFPMTKRFFRITQKNKTNSLFSWWAVKLNKKYKLKSPWSFNHANKGIAAPFPSSGQKHLHMSSAIIYLFKVNDRKSVWNMFKVSNKYTRMMQLMSCCSYC